MDQSLSPDIFTYMDFRLYLADWQSARQKLEPTFTRSQLSRLLGMPSTRSYFTDILRDRKLSEVMVERLVEIMALPDDRTRHFRRLVRLGQALSAQEKELAFEEVIQAVRAPSRVLAPPEFSYYADWTHSVVRAAVSLHPDVEDASVLARSIEPCLPVARVREALELLLELGLVRRSSRGGYEPTEASISSPPHARQELVRNYQLQVLERVREVVAHPPETGHNVSTNVITLSREALSRVERRLQAFKDEVRAIVQADRSSPEMAYQIVVATIPVAREIVRTSARATGNAV